MWYGFIKPYFQILFGSVLVTGAKLFLKIGAEETAPFAESWGWTGLGTLASSFWVWWGMVLMVLSFFSWLWALKFLPLAIAYPISNVSTFSAAELRDFLDEVIGARRWCGILLVLVGLVIVAKPFSKIEERL